MSQLYIADGTILKCTDGRRLQQIKVTSQSSVYFVKGAKLAATENDRFSGDFICPKMMVAGAVAGLVLTAAFISTGPLALAVGAFAGSALIDDVLDVCSLLTMCSEWSVVHPKVKFEKQKALMEKATLNCFFGGVVSFTIFSEKQITDLKVAAAMANSCYKDYEDETIGGFKRIDTADQNELDRLFGRDNFSKEDFDTNKDTGFYAALFHNQETGEYFVAFRGSEFENPETDESQIMQDWVVEDGGQALGFHTPQIEATRSLAEKMKAAAPGKVTYTGHSLGGGNSAMASYVTGSPGYTFNARGVHPNTLEYLDSFENSAKTTQNIHAYNTSHDVLNFGQNHREGLFGLLASRFPIIGGLVYGSGAMPRALGEQHELDVGGINFGNIVSGHSDYQKPINDIIRTMNTTVYAKDL